MSPLACSLLALAALLAATDAKITLLPQPPGAKCAGYIMDITSKKFGGFIKEVIFEYQINGDGQLHMIKDGCADDGAAISSQTVRVCNEFHSEVPLWYPPRVFALGDEKLSPVFAACDPWVEAAGKCGPLTVNVTQVCSLPYYPPELLSAFMRGNSK